MGECCSLVETEEGAAMSLEIRQRRGEGAARLKETTSLLGWSFFLGVGSC